MRIVPIFVLEGRYLLLIDRGAVKGLQSKVKTLRRVRAIVIDCDSFDFVAPPYWICLFWGLGRILLDWIKSLTKNQKRAIMVALDCCMVLSSLLIAFAVQSLPGGVLVNMISYLQIMPYLLAAAIGTSIWLGVSSIQLNDFETAAVGLTGIFALFVTITSVILTNVAGLQIPLGAHLVFGAVLFSLIVISRAALLQIVLAIYRRSTSRCRVLIYGAGTTGTQLVLALRRHETI